MIKETMTREERIRAALNLEIPDRVPVVPLIGQFAYRYQGLSRMYRHQSPSTIGAGDGDKRDYRKILQAFQDTFDALGGYDSQYSAGIGSPVSSWRANGPRIKWVMPGQQGVSEDFSVQTSERELMTAEDYDTIINLGWNGFCEEYFPRATGRSLEEMDAVAKMLLKLYKEGAGVWKERGVIILTGAVALSCEMILSLARTLPQFTLDLHRRPDRVQAALEAMVPDVIQNAINDTRASGIPFVHLSLERGSGAYYNLKTYERFFFPQLKKMVNAFAAEGLVSVLHMDTDWTLNLPYLLELPEKMCICELDSTTDIFKAKEILKDHMCIMGDVPPGLLSYGTTEEVIAYCQKLMDIVGEDGGFILSTGCECPIDARFDNVRAMIDTAKTHAPR